MPNNPPTPNAREFISHHFFLPFALLAAVDATLTARELDADVALLPAPDLTALICLFCHEC
jgi:hypothetical protein